MDTDTIIALIVGLVVGGSLGASIMYLANKGRVMALEAQAQSDNEKLDWIRNAQSHLREVFAALSMRALREGHKDFAEKAKGFSEGINLQLNTHRQELNTHRDTVKILTDKHGSSMGQYLTTHFSQINQLKVGLETNIGQQLTFHSEQINVVKDSLEKSIDQIDKHIRELEVERKGAYHSLRDHVVNLEKAHRELQKMTEHLVNALRSGPVRGKWGEIQLRKIVELAGMVEHVDFLQQPVGETGRPDMVVRMSNNGQLSVDSKFLCSAYLEAMASTDEVLRKKKIDEHRQSLRREITKLSSKKYWEEFQPSPELVIMFIPIESSLMSAYDVDPKIVEFALENKVILTSPTTLLGLMKSIAFGWQQFMVDKNSKKILEGARELFKRTVTWLDHFHNAGEKLDDANSAYNSAVASLMSRFIPKVRELQNMAMQHDDLPDLGQTETGIRRPPRTREMEGEPGLFDD